MKFEETPEFRKDLKRLNKKYRSLSADLQTFRGIIAANPLGNPGHFRVITSTDQFHIIKARMQCRYLIGPVLRVVYAYIEVQRRVEFIELYFKGDKENEDRERIQRYLAASTE